jgi:hypothetical protein
LSIILVVLLKSLADSATPGTRQQKIVKPKPGKTKCRRGRLARAFFQYPQSSSLLHLHPTVLVPILVRLISGLSGAASTNFFLTRSVDLENSPPPPINSESDTMVKFQQRYQNSHRIVISGIVGYSLNADTPDGPPIRLFGPRPVSMLTDFQSSRPEISLICASDRPRKVR